MTTPKEIPGFPQYFASADGRIYSSKVKGGNDRARGRVGSLRELSYQTDRKGYVRVNLDMFGKNKSACVHVLVLLAHAGVPSAGEEACHYPDSNKRNNRIENLRWGTHAENMGDKYRDEDISAPKTCRRCMVRKSRTEFYTDSRASDGRHAECRLCHSAVSMATRDPEKKRVANREYMRRKRAAA